MKKNNFITYLSLILSLASCGELIETDISDKDVFLITPSDNLTLDSGRFICFWEPVEDALNYSLQVVSGPFNEPDVLILDTLVWQNKILLTLDSGAYSWGVSALNGNYQTPYSVRNLTVNTTKKQEGTIELVFPTDGQTLSDTAFQFSWRTSSSVDEYIFKIIDVPGASTVTESPYVLKIFQNQTATYNWQVLGVIRSNNTIIESPTYSFTIQESNN